MKTDAKNDNNSPREPAERRAGTRSHLNVVIVEGVVRGEPVSDELADGTQRLAFDVKGDGHEAPVTWFGPASKVPKVREGTRVTVVGSIRRYFYRSRGAVVSRTDVVAEVVVTGSGKRRHNTLVGAIDQLSERVEEGSAA